MDTSHIHNLRARVGQIFQIRFRTDQESGARWVVGARPGAAVRHRADRNIYDVTRPAAPVAQAFEFEAVRPGKTTFELDLVDEEGQVQRREIYDVSVTASEDRPATPRGDLAGPRSVRSTRKAWGPMACAEVG